ncbi:uncharacterized protein JCM15063_001149 [Sporobolomyces koalae]|uniref:uncharacterized protein n=1 Tax=Sporobolomyces koalae TaxID=500713 RepID=UPI00317D4167
MNSLTAQRRSPSSKFRLWSLASVLCGLSHTTLRHRDIDMDAALEAELLKFVSTLDSSENPYAALSAWVSERALPTVPHSAVLQLYVLAAILGA